MTKIDGFLSDIHTLAVLGHVRPDGDCVGSTMAIFNYVTDNYPQIKVQVYLGSFSEELAENVPGCGSICFEAPEEAPVYDLCISIDCSTLDRLDQFRPVFDRASSTLCIDHHMTNRGFADANVIDGDASSACEVLYTLLDPEKISQRTADCLFTGIVHDTGCFCHENTSAATLRIAGDLIEKGARASELIFNTFSSHTFKQIKLIGRALHQADLEYDGRVIISLMTYEDMLADQGRPMDVEPVIDEMRVAKGVRCAVFARENADGSWRGSLRANGDMNVAQVAERFGGGGHLRAAGCTLYGNKEEVRRSLLDAVGEALAK